MTKDDLCAAGICSLGATAQVGILIQYALSHIFTGQGRAPFRDQEIFLLSTRAIGVSFQINTVL